MTGTRGVAAALALLAVTGCWPDREAVPRAEIVPRAEPTDPNAPRVVVKVVTPSVPAGTYAEAVVRLENAGGQGSWMVSFGDSGREHGGAVSDVRCGPRPGAVEEHRVRHAYRYPGDWTVTVTFTSGACGGEPPRGYQGSAVVRVTPAPDVPGNGPEPPLLHGVVQHGHPSAKGLTRLEAFPDDEDGYLTEIRYAWGDGSPDTVFTFPLSQCVDPHDHWPTSRWPGSLDKAEWTSPEHRYARAGSYTVTVTVVSTACDGTSPQRVSESAVVTAG